MSKQGLRGPSLGAGVQSTVVALMACDGALPGLNAAIFADTGWEPPPVYEQVDRIVRVAVVERVVDIEPLARTGCVDPNQDWCTTERAGE